MLNLNPFKKKEDGFSLDNYSLPTVKEQEKNQNPMGFDNSLPNSNSNFGDMSSQSGTDNNSFLPPVQQPQQDQNSFSQFPSNDVNSQSNNFSQSNSRDPYVQQEISRTRLDTIEAKLSLIQSKMSNLENTLEKVYEMLSYEISDETKQKLNFKTLSSSARDKLENNR